MDIGRPNNFPRIVSLFDGNYEDIIEVCWGASFSDDETERHIRRIHTETGYVMCPHTAVGHLAMEAFAADIGFPFTRVTVGTAHPAKFADSVERILHADIPMPEPLAKAMKKTKRVHVMAPRLSDLSDYLDNNL
jgi:threonine synthase